MEKVLWVQTLAQSKRFLIEGVDIDFDNGNRSLFERIRFQGEGSWVMIVAIEKEGSDTYVYLIEHFLVWVEKREFLLPWWYRESGLSLFEAASKELKEEVWLWAREIRKLIDVEFLPWYMKWHTQLCLATDLYPEQLKGDEVETMIVHRLNYKEALELIDQWKITDARTIAGLLYAEKILKS